MTSIRKATVSDVPVMAQLINDNAELGLMLPKSLAMLYETVRAFHVVEDDGQVVGLCAMTVIWANWGEIASLAVDRSQRGKGLGRQLVEACLEEARALGVPRVMTLTYEQAFFERLGFAVLDRQQLPLKVWSECVRCPKNQACDEIAMSTRIAGVPEPEEMPNPPKPTAYEVPVVLTSRGRSGQGG
ncbi:MAG: N-acetyltransferase [Phycisphaeraceae bacterium]